MLFDSKECMSWILRTYAIIIISLNFIISTSAQTQRDNAMKISADFESFLQDLGSLVYKSKKHSNHERLVHKRFTTTVPHKRHRMSNTLYNTQKAALGDVLMMKLVSYYEDKYKLTHHEPTTTEDFIFTRKSRHHFADKYNIFDESDSKLPTIERNTGIDGQIIRMNYEEPEVITL